MVWSLESSLPVRTNSFLSAVMLLIFPWILVSPWARMGNVNAKHRAIRTMALLIRIMDNPPLLKLGPQTRNHEEPGEARHRCFSGGTERGRPPPGPHSPSHQKESSNPDARCESMKTGRSAASSLLRRG